jgi:hypothetical protein
MVLSRFEDFISAASCFPDHPVAGMGLKRWNHCRQNRISLPTGAYTGSCRGSYRCLPAEPIILPHSAYPDLREVNLHQYGPPRFASWIWDANDHFALGR